MECALHHARQILHAVDAIHAFAERTENLKLIGVLMQIHFLMWMTTVVIRRDIAGDHHHRNRIERGISDARRCIRQSRPQVQHQHARLARRARVSVRRMRRDLLMSSRDKTNLAFPQRIQKSDHRMSAQPEDDFDAEPLQVIRQQIRGDPVPVLGLKFFYFDKVGGRTHRNTSSCSSWSWLWQNSPKSSSSGGRSSAIGRLTQVTFM